MAKSRASIKRGESHKAASRKRTSKQSKQQRRTSRRTSRRMNKRHGGGESILSRLSKLIRTPNKKEYVERGLNYLEVLKAAFTIDKDNTELLSATNYYINKINKVNITYEKGEIDTFIHGELCKNILDIKYFYIKLAIGLELEELEDLLRITYDKEKNNLDKYKDSIQNTYRILYTIYKNKDYIDQNECVIDDDKIMQIREELLLKWRQ